MQSANTSEVVSSFLVSERLVGFLKDTPNATRIDLSDEIQRLKASILHQSEAELLTQITNQDRQTRYRRARWVRGEVELGKCWVWPKMGGVQWAAGKVPEVAAILSVHANEPGRYCTDIKKAETFRDIAIHLPVVAAELPIMVFGGDGIHKPYTRLRRGQLAYDIDDGCHRAIAAWFAGWSKIPAFVGNLPD
jgi:hypothetical protein